MLYGNEHVQKKVLKHVKEFEEKYNRKMIFGAVLGSISQGKERYDSDYDSRFLYLDRTEQGYVRWDKLSRNIQENEIHQCYIPGRGYMDGIACRENMQYLQEKKLFYDKIAFWEFTSFVKLLVEPRLDNSFSVGLYHTAGWTFHSPFCWDPYGIKNKISCLVDELFNLEYEIQYYRDYILKIMKKDKVKLKEYLFSAYYALAMQYCICHHRFAPIYFKTLLATNRNDELESAILSLEQEYYHVMDVTIRTGDEFERKMTSEVYVKKNNVIEEFLAKVLAETEKYCKGTHSKQDEYYSEKIVEIVLDSV